MQAFEAGECGGAVEDDAEAADQLRGHALPPVSRNITLDVAEPGRTHAASARAGIESLRAIEDVVTAAPRPSQEGSSVNEAGRDPNLEQESALDSGPGGAAASASGTPACP
ncbi:hypothetical protein ACQ3I4_05395 [Zafaria sp. Z1313]|uniref:hypothetical protein n=1 Tax=unclassified Zafaria TaxID=2828765 RepID=UPI002E78F732|nr:hypothetical protein [Zafaria sp. J156]MEE1621313.1 hypothetical protein [Zafaria sp. J156]